MSEPAVNWFPEELDAVRPPERITISEWAAKKRILASHSAIKGLYRLSMVPPLVPIMDRCNDPGVDEQVICKPAQYGGTDAILNVIGFYSDQDPSPIGIVLADQKTSEYVSTQKIKSMFKDSEHLRHLYNPNNFTKKEIVLPNGGYIGICWASSVADLGTKTFRIMIFDEIDKEGYYVTTKEASPLSLGRERTDTYPEGHKKHILTSTPTTVEGNIIREMDACDIVLDWHVPCPYCGQFQPLRWNPKYANGFSDGMYRAEDGTMHHFGRVVWEGGREATNKQISKTVRYECGECGELWTTAEKNNAVRKGKEVPRTEPTGYERTYGNHVNRIYSLFAGGKLEKLVTNWVKIFRLSGNMRQKALQGFINSTLAEPFSQVTVTSTETKILKARCDLPPQTVPKEAIALSAGIDKQKRGYWFVVRAWSRDFTSWLIHKGHLNNWDEVENLLFESSYPIDCSDGEDQGKFMKIWRAALDTGGGKGEEGEFSMTEDAYWWIRYNGRGRGCYVWATKGSSRPLAGKVHVGKALDKTPSGKPIPGGLLLVLLDTDKIKDMVYHRFGLAIEGRPQGAYLHSGTEKEYKDYVSQILAEEKQRDRKGIEKWVQVRGDNHFLDAEGLCQIVVEPEWVGGGLNLLRGPALLGDKNKKPKNISAKSKGTPENWLRKSGYDRPSWLDR
ncbi:MAG: phage terminase large subunit family protein [Deltaproteobacteria bacterium]|nr:phage terminase large subunit family protein [Deltaproteobacteria bacterium]